MDQLPPEPDEAELIRRAAGGDLAAVRKLVEAQAQPLFAIAKSLVANSTDAEDLVQDAILAGLDSIRRFRGQSSFRTWLVAILMKQVAAWRRREYVRRTSNLPTTPEAGSADKVMISTDGTTHADVRLDLKAAMDKLSPDYREVLTLRELGGLSYDEIATALKLPRGTVESRIHRARMELREHMKGYS